MSSELRAKAREKLTGKWGKAACISLAYLVIAFLIGFIQGHVEGNSFLSFIVSIIAFIIEVPLSFGLMYSYYKLFKDEETFAFDFCSLGFSNFGKSWGITWHMILKMIIPVILMIISYVLIAFSVSLYVTSSFSYIYSGSTSGLGMAGLLSIVGIILLIFSVIWGITKYYYYALSYLIAMDNPEMTSKEAVEESKKLMTNNRGKLFGLQISFIGWAILTLFTLGIGYIWLIPYMQFAIICFYDKVKETNA